MPTNVKPSVTVLDAGITDVSVAVWRKTDGRWFDFGDATFKDRPGTRLAPMSQDPEDGTLWTLSIVTTGNAQWTTDNYTYFYYNVTGGTPVPMGSPDTEFVQGGQGNLPPNTATISGIDDASLSAINNKIRTTADIEGLSLNDIMATFLATSCGNTPLPINNGDGTLTVTFPSVSDPGQPRIRQVWEAATGKRIGLLLFIASDHPAGGSPPLG